MENYNVYLKKFQVAIGIAVFALVVLIVMIVKTAPEVQKIFQFQNDYKTASASLADAERKLEELKISSAKKASENENIADMFFKPINGGLDTEAAITDEFGEILQLMRDNKIKARSVKYDYDPQDDNFVKFAGTRYHVCKVSTEMIASYANFAKFLRELYKHEHFLDISKIEIIPYEKNKRILLVSFQFKLYAQKDAASAAAEAAEAAERAAAEKNKDNANAPSPKTAE